MTRAVEQFPPAGESVLFDDRVFTGFFAVVAVLMAAGIGLFLWLLVRNLRMMRRVGVHPVQGAASRAVVGHRPGVPLAQRLQELDDLRRRGVITDAEHALARHEVLTS